jgi:tRNA(His) 5'-end guanylyltransferase
MYKSCKNNRQNNKVEKLWQLYGLPAPKSEASKGELSLVDYEIYSGIELPDNYCLFVRLDGWNFHSLTKKLSFDKPYDKFFAKALVEVAKEFFVTFNSKLAYIFSDELNLLFLKTPGWKRIEKIDSVFAGIASAKFYSKLKERFSEPLPRFAFDCRCIPLPRTKIIDYLRWRQAECFRNFNNAWAQYSLLKKGYSPSKATKALAGMKTKKLRRLLFENIPKDKLEAWQERGILLYKEGYLKEGYNPIKREKVKVERHRVIEIWDLLLFNSREGIEFIDKLLGESFVN